MQAQKHAGPDIENVRKRRPALAKAVESYQAFAATKIDPALVELCRLRIGQITTKSDAPVAATPASRAAGITDGQLRELAHYEDSNQFSAAEKACLRLAEYFCYTAQGVTDEQVEQVNEHLSAEQILVLTSGIWVADASSRLANYLGSLEVSR